MKISVTTIEKVVLEAENIKQVTLPSLDGIIAILEDHEPLISALGTGEVIIEINDKDKSQELIFVDGGIIKVEDNQIDIITDFAEKADDMDEAIIEDAIRKAQKLKEEQPVDVDIAEVESSLRREMAKSHFVEKWKHTSN